MERLQSKIEGKGNGIKTVVVNLSNVAQQLARPPTCKSPSILIWQAVD
jgi:translation initiation factor 5